MPNLTGQDVGEPAQWFKASVRRLMLGVLPRALGQFLFIWFPLVCKCRWSGTEEWLTAEL